MSSTPVAVFMPNITAAVNMSYMIVAACMPLTLTICMPCIIRNGVYETLCPNHMPVHKDDTLS